MSLLAPLYALGALAVALPVLFHLIRRQTSQRVPISSLMFLPPSSPPPRRRRRLENLPLLLLRGLALLLLALAFSRPFLRSPDTALVQQVDRRVVILIDTSASMRRGDLWDQALAHLRGVTAELGPRDALAVVTFDAQPTMRLDFEAAAALPPGSLRQLDQQLFAGEGPSWHSTDLAAALRWGAELATRDRATGSSPAESQQAANGSAAAQVVLISDLQAGAALDSLQGFAWPEQVPVELRRVTPARRGNAWISLPTDPRGLDSAEPPAAAQTEAGHDFRFRVTNAADSQQAQFRLAWVTATQASIPAGASVQVLPGHSKTLRLPAPPDDAVALVLAGDEHDFDNLRYFVNTPPAEQTLLYIGEEAPEPRGSLFYYLQRLALDTPARRVSVQRHPPAAPLATPLDPRQVALVVASGRLEPELAEPLRRYVRRGGSLLYVLPEATTDTHGRDALRLLGGAAELGVSEANVEDYAMLGRIDFTDPLFAPLADPKFNDFSKIRFWAHRTLTGIPEGWRTLVSFDDGAPALLQHDEGRGRLWVLAAGWQPLESQLALSTKFIALMFGMVDAAGPTEQRNGHLQLGDPFVESAASDDAPIDRPGIYRAVDGDDTTAFAVNVAEQESRTEPLDEDELQRLGVVLGKASAADHAQAERQLRDLELESQQRLWQWLLLAVLGLLGVETWWGGWSARRRAGGVQGNTRLGDV